jgi:hypothetical protein
VTFSVSTTASRCSSKREVSLKGSTRSVREGSPDTYSNSGDDETGCEALRTLLSFSWARGPPISYSARFDEPAGSGPRTSCSDGREERRLPNRVRAGTHPSHEASQPPSTGRCPRLSDRRLPSLRRAVRGRLRERTPRVENDRRSEFDGRDSRTDRIERVGVSTSKPVYLSPPERRVQTSAVRRDSHSTARHT